MRHCSPAHFQLNCLEMRSGWRAPILLHGPNGAAFSSLIFFCFVLVYFFQPHPHIAQHIFNQNREKSREMN